MCSSASISSFSGSIVEFPEISVDRFTDVTSSAYFLSHCHADHTEGLYSQRLLDHLIKDNVYVYMSEVSAAIVRLESTNSGLHDYIRPLPVGTTVVPVPGNPLWEPEPQAVSVTVVPARHCPGSVMLVLESVYRRVLYTGDCRLEGAGEYRDTLRGEDHTPLHIDTLYLDTTFYSAEYAEFPSRSHSARATHTHMRRWLERDDHYIALHTSARYGYEFVFNDIYKHLHTKVLVSDAAWSLYSEFPSLMVGVTADPTTTSSRVHVCRNRSHTKGHDDCLRGHRAPGARFLYVHYSALKWTGYKPGDDVVQLTQQDNHTRLDVCFATHSSRSEIDKFVEFLRPRKVVGFPRPYHLEGGGDTSPLDDHLQQEEDSEEEWVHGYKPDLEDPWGSGDDEDGGDMDGAGDTRREDRGEEDTGEESSEEVSAKRRKLSAAGEEGDGGGTLEDEELDEEEEMGEESNMLTAEELRSILCPGGDDDILYYESCG